MLNRGGGGGGGRGRAQGQLPGAVLQEEVLVTP